MKQSGQKGAAGRMIAALVIAAGRTGRKMGFAPQKKVGTISAIERAVTVLQRADISHICVVCADSQTEKLVARRNVVFLRSSSGAQMFDCIKQGLGYLRDQCDAALIVPVDLALCSVQTVRALAAARGSVCVPAYQGRNGHPILLRGDCFDTLCAYTGPGGLGGAIYHAGLDRTVVPVDDAGILEDVQRTPEARRLPGTQELQKLCPEVEITLCKEQPFFGPQTLQLLRLTQETGSLLAACRRVGVSYSKGRGMIAATEAQLGGALLARQQGGASGGSSVVTARGAQLMQRYRAYCDAVQASARDLFGVYFPEET